MATCTSYPSDVCDWEWAVAVPYLSLLAPPALQRKYELRAVFNAVRYLAHTGAPWRYLPSDFPPWAVVESASPSVVLRSFLADIQVNVDGVKRAAAQVAVPEMGPRRVVGHQPLTTV